MIPSSSATSLLPAFELLCCEIDELRTSNAKSVVLLKEEEKIEFIIIHWKLICDSNDDFWLVGIYRGRDKQGM